VSLDNRIPKHWESRAAHRESRAAHREIRAARREIRAAHWESRIHEQPSNARATAERESNRRTREQPRDQLSEEPDEARQGPFHEHARRTASIFFCLTTNTPIKHVTPLFTPTMEVSYLEALASAVS